MIAQAPRKYPRTARFLGAAAALFAVLGFAAPGLFVLAAWLALVAFILARGPNANVTLPNRADDHLERSWRVSYESRRSYEDWRRTSTSN